VARSVLVETGDAISVPGRGNLGAGRQKLRQTANDEARRERDFKDKKRDKRYAVRNRASRGDHMDLRCPQCNSTDLKKLSLAYLEGISHLNARTQLRGVVVGSDGPDLVVGSGTMKGIQQTAISKTASPPTKWSYKRLVGWSVLAFLAAGWIVFYTNTVVTNSQTVSSVPLTVYTVVAMCAFAGAFVGFWRHNHSTYPREFAHWDCSYLCGRCGTVSEHSIGSAT
jgi:hypothetical protein